MKDYAHGVAVSIRPAKRGKWRVRCPECKTPIVCYTHFGAIAALQAHLDAHHFIPLQGNA